MLYDQYANYVVQRALSVADEEQGEFDLFGILFDLCGVFFDLFGLLFDLFGLFLRLVGSF